MANRKTTKKATDAPAPVEAAVVEAVAETPVVEEAPAPVKKTAAKKPAAKKAPAAEAKSAKKPAEKPAQLFIQFGGKEYDYEEIVEKCKAAYKEGNSRKQVRTIKVYVKPEEHKAYYLVNDKNDSYSIDL